MKQLNFSIRFAGLGVALLLVSCTLKKGILKHNEFTEIKKSNLEGRKVLVNRNWFVRPTTDSYNRLVLARVQNFIPDDVYERNKSEYGIIVGVTGEATNEYAVIQLQDALFFMHTKDLAIYETIEKHISATRSGANKERLNQMTCAQPIAFDDYPLVFLPKGNPIPNRLGASDLVFEGGMPTYDSIKGNLRFIAERDGVGDFSYGGRICGEPQGRKALETKLGLVRYFNVIGIRAYEIPWGREWVIIIENK